MAEPEKNQEAFPEVGRARCLARLFWMVRGFATLLILAILVAQNDGFLSWVDAGFWLVFSLCIGLRCLDARYLKGQTAQFEPATMYHGRRYSLLVALPALGFWLSACVVGPWIMSRAGNAGES